MGIVALVLKRPYTVPAVLILVCLLGIGAALIALIARARVIIESKTNVSQDVKARSDTMRPLARYRNALDTASRSAPRMNGCRRSKISQNSASVRR